MRKRLRIQIAHTFSITQIPPLNAIPVPNRHSLFDGRLRNRNRSLGLSNQPSFPLYSFNTDRITLDVDESVPEHARPLCLIAYYLEKTNHSLQKSTADARCCEQYLARGLLPK